MPEDDNKQKSDWPDVVHGMFQDFLIIAAIITLVALLLFQGPSCCRQFEEARDPGRCEKNVRAAAQAERERMNNE